MFKRILAIDIAARLPSFTCSAQEISTKSPLVLATSDQLLAENDLAEIDAVLISIYQPLSAEMLKALPNVRYIGILGTSTKLIERDLCIERGIKLSPVTGYCDHETAEWVVGQIIKHFRDPFPNHPRRSDTDKLFKPRSVYGRSLGLIGVGAVGSKLAHLAQALGMKLAYNARNSQPELEKLGAKLVSKQEIFRNSELISLHTPAHLAWLDKDLLSLCQKNTLIINTCLGQVFQDGVLEQVLPARPDIKLIMDKIAGAGNREVLAKLSPSVLQAIYIDMYAAYETLDSSARLIENFWHNAQAAS